MVVATHNPANLALQTIEIKVPHANFKVSKLESGVWVDAVASVICND
jgi:hypothetical protein